MRVFAGFCVFDCSMDFMPYFRSLTLENPQNKRSAVSLVNPSHDTFAIRFAWILKFSPPLRVKFHTFPLPCGGGLRGWVKYLSLRVLAIARRSKPNHANLKTLRINKLDSYLQHYDSNHSNALCFGFFAHFVRSEWRNVKIFVILSVAKYPNHANLKENKS